MVLSLDDLLKSITAKVSGTSDDDIVFLENCTDTINSMINVDNEDWKKKFEENDSMWRQKYISRFSTPAETEKKENKTETETETETETCFENEHDFGKLFK